MPRRSAGGYLTLLRSLWRDLLFRSIVVGTLIIVAAIFATRPRYEPPQKQTSSEYANQKTTDKIESNGFLGIGPDAWTAIFTGVLTLFTGLLVTTGCVQIQFLIRADETGRKSADAAKRSADVARDALISSNRAWLKIDVRISNQPFMKLDDGGFQFAVDLFARNIGNAPAINVSPHAWMLAWRDDPGMNPFVLHARKCDEVRRQAHAFKHLLYPEEEFPSPPGSTFGLAIKLNKEDVEASLGLVTNAEGKTGLMIFIGGCFDYTFASDPEGRHQTQFLLSLEKFPPGPFMVDESIIPIERLTLGPPAFGSGVTVT